MTNYNWNDHRNAPWLNRYPQWVQGAAEWESQGTFGPDWQPPAVSGLRTKRRLLPRAQPVLFVTHRRANTREALRIAWIADQEGFGFWIDVLNPNIAAAHAAKITPQQRGLAIASIIEMGLLNSTHVIAVMTRKTAGSQWVPYEYGRAKDPAVASLQAACWVHKSLPTPSLPEYLQLGTIAHTEADIRSWLSNQAPGIAKPAGNWLGPAPLPSL